MAESEWLVEGFEKNRPRLRAVAYRMLGSLAEADDAVQETWLRLRRSDASGVDNLGAWLTTIVARVCLNVLRSRNTRREAPMGMNVPAHGRLTPRATRAQRVQAHPGDDRGQPAGEVLDAAGV